MIDRSKGVCAVALGVGFGCAFFGVGGATADSRAHLRHVHRAKLEGLALNHRSPGRPVLAIRPKVKPAHTAPGHAAVTPAAATRTATATTGTTTASTTTPGNSTTTPGTTTAGTTTKTVLSTRPNGHAWGRQHGTGRPIATGGIPAGTTATGTALAAGPAARGRQAGTVGSSSSSPQCHGRCAGAGVGHRVVPASLRSSNASANSNRFGLRTGSIRATPAVILGAPVNDATASSLTSVSSSPRPPAPAPTAPSTPAASPFIALRHIPTFNSASAIERLALRSGSHHRAATAPTAARTGSGTRAAAGPTATGIARAAAAGTAVAAAAKAVTHKPAHRATSGHLSSGGSQLPTPLRRFERFFVNVIPMAVWLALGAAFALMLAFAGVAFRSSRRARRREREFAAISAAALTDSLTGILNRRGFTEAAERELARASRYGRRFVLAYMDVRGLKAVNDTAGHLVGDHLIKRVAGLLTESARADDVVGRIGGDEFALLLAEQTAQSGAPVIRRIQARVAEARAAMEISVPWELTIGIASFPDDGATLEELLDFADRQLYEQRGIALR